jgi:membrane associated rhomboid family serine protease
MGIYDRPYYPESVPGGLAPSWDGRSAISQIIIVNVVAFAANAIFSGRDDSLTNFLSLHAGDLFQPWMLWRLLTYGFVHDPANIFHLFWNMLSLWMLGRAVEDRYGKAEFLRVYLTAVVGAGLVWLIRHSLWKDDASVVLGASGAVTCVVMLFVFLYPKVQVYFWGVLPVPAWVLGLILVLGDLMAGSGPNVAYDVHLAGAAWAAIYFFRGIHLRWMEQPWSRLKTIFQGWVRPDVKLHDPEATAKDDAEADRILDKIHRQGQSSLTSSERRFMEKYSRRVRQRRQS